MKKKKKIAMQYKAADGGEVPDDEDDLSLDDPKEDDSEKSVQSDQDAKADDESDDELVADNSDRAPVSPSGLDDSKVQAARDYIAQKYKQAADPTGVQQAQEEAQHSNFVANMGQALETLARSNSMAHGGSGVNSAIYQGIRDQGQQGVQRAMATRQQAIQNFVTQNQMNHEAIADIMSTGKYNDEQAMNQLKLAQSDPNSDISQRKVGALKQMFAKVPGMENIPWDGMSAVEADDISKNADPLVRLQQIAQDKKTMLGFRQDQINQQHEQVAKQSAIKDQSSLAKDLDTQTATTRTNIGQAQTKVNGANRLMTFADVTPDEITAAKSDPTAKAALIQKLNKLSPQQYTEVVSGLMGQISNGAGSFGQLEHMRANTADQTMANLAQYFQGKPAGANVGGLIYNNLLTLKNEADTSQSVIDKHASLMKAKHPLAFTHPETKDDSDRMLESFSQPETSSLGQSLPQGPTAAQNMMAMDLPSDPKQLIPGKAYRLKNGGLGTFNGRGFAPLTPQAQTATAMTGQ